MNRKISGMLLAGGVASLSAGFAQAQEFGAGLNGFEELGGLNAETGAILSNGKGTLSLDVDKSQITYTLTYSGLSAPVTPSHIHLGKIHVPGAWWFSAHTWGTDQREPRPARRVAGR